MQLQHAIDHDKARKNDIYKFYTKIVSFCNEDGILVVSFPLVEDVEESLLVDPDNELAADEL
ncbi:15922_t:CDS:2 [Dentiscutata heterogama]|uniref:15922_t:CDS:1 n=1 Tax=Dentiscutata heterogama TaxID=1316150 RepID=A0ACA9LJS6_9GLOM|nr:15922_t:CDS:2 [Dentiscutata heterogama]